MGEVVGIALGGALALTVPNRPDLIRDPVITWLQRARTVLGLLAGVWLVMAYPLRKGREEFVLDKLGNLALGCAIMLGAGAVLAADVPLGLRDGDGVWVGHAVSEPGLSCVVELYR